MQQWFLTKRCTYGTARLLTASSQNLKMQGRRDVTVRAVDADTLEILRAVSPVVGSVISVLTFPFLLGKQSLDILKGKREDDEEREFEKNDKNVRFRGTRRLCRSAQPERKTQFASFWFNCSPCSLFRR